MLSLAMSSLSPTCAAHFRTRVSTWKVATSCRVSVPDFPQKKQEVSLVVASEECVLARLPGTLSVLRNAELLAMSLFSALRSIVLLYLSIHVLCHLAWWATIVASTPCPSSSLCN